MAAASAKEKLVVIGNGMAGLRFLEELQTESPHAHEVTVFGAEPEPAYNRVLLSSLLAGDSSRSDIAFRSRDWYQTRGINLQTGVAVEHIDRSTRMLTLSDKRTCQYDKLVLATGSQPIILPLPGHDLENVLTFRNLDDVAELQSVSANTQAVVIGGGLLGLETAYGLRRLGASVTQIHLMDRLMERQLDQEAANLLKEKIEILGINILLEADTAAIEGIGRVQSVRLKDGRSIPADLLVMAVGIRPEASLASNAALDVNRGVLVNDELRTSDPDIFAVGECAEHRGIAYGLVEPLYMQAKILAKRLSGELTDLYQGSTTSTNLKVSGIEIFSAGTFETVENADPIYYRDRANGVYKKLQIVRQPNGEQILIGAVLVGDRDDGPWYAELIANKTPIEKMRGALMFGRELAERAA